MSGCVYLQCQSNHTFTTHTTSHKQNISFLIAILMNISYMHYFDSLSLPEDSPEISGRFCGKRYFSPKYG